MKRLAKVRRRVQRWERYVARVNELKGATCSLRGKRLRPIWRKGGHRPCGYRRVWRRLVDRQTARMHRN